MFMALQVAFFVTSHGFGHAARACAVMYQLRQMYDDIHFHIFSSLPTHVFTLELIGSAYFYNNSIDVGVKQNGALDFDLNATARSLEVFLSGFDADAERLAVQLHALRCDWVICDIAPLGIAAATYLGLPVVLIENFSWSWIYSGFQYDHPVLRDAIDKFDSVRKMAGLKIQASPCFFTDDADYVVAPISRPVLCPPGDVRVNLGISPGEKLVLVSLGGFQYHMRNMATAAARQGVRYLVLGQPESWHEGNVIALSTREYVYLPDVVEACD
ncbi:MAG: hypothetical protein KGZ62_01145, partial [Sulfurimonas sp.]|nr:hypothetical protein [Sulfurimonas sp.]